MRWHSNSDHGTITSINISGKSISDKNFYNYIINSIRKDHIDPKRLCFEINEIAAIDHLTAAIHFMATLKKLGCSLAIDNFGCGHSSFSYLESLPIDFIKIDGRFIVDIDNDPVHHAMVRSIHQAAQQMKIKTIAEHAASTEIIEVLRKIGIDYAQGFAVAPPIPLASFSDLAIDSKTGRKPS